MLKPDPMKTGGVFDDAVSLKQWLDRECMKFQKKNIRESERYPGFVYWDASGVESGITTVYWSEELNKKVK